LPAAAPLVVGHIEWRGLHHRRVVDEDVDAAAPGGRRFPEPLRTVGVLEVGLHEQPAPLRNLRDGVARARLVGPVVSDYVRAGLAEGARDRGADSLRRTGDDDRAAAELLRHAGAAAPARLSRYARHVAAQTSGSSSGVSARLCTT